MPVITGRLFIEIQQAHDLPTMDLGSYSDPYVVVRVGNQQIGRTKTVENNNNPSWQEKFQADIEADEELMVTFEVWDNDPMQRDDLIGSFHIPLKAVKSSKKIAGGEEDVIVSPIEGKHAKASSSLVYCINIRKFGGELKADRPGNKKAVQVAINYLSLPEGKGRLKGCYTDIEVMNDVLTSKYGFQPENIRTLRDDHENAMPTRANITAALKWLVHDAKKGDSLYFQFSGHGGQVDDLDGDEEDHKDETIIPCDFKSAGQITDDELFNILVDPLPAGVFVTVIMDCCHSGTGMDLPYVHNIQTSKVHDNNNAAPNFARKPKTVNNNNSSSDANVVMFSGCLDSQTSADASIKGKFSGAMTYAIKTALDRHNYDVNYQQLLVDMHQILTDGHYSQIPMLSTARPFNLQSKFNI